MPSVHFAIPRVLSRFVLIALTTVAVATIPAAASTTWNWNFSGSGVAANGTFTTQDKPNSAGGYLITGITGTRDGVTITSLQKTGTSIPGNEPYVVDNLVFAGPGAQLTSSGFGFATSDGDFSNPFYAGFLPTPGYLEFFSTPPSTGGGRFGHSELPIQFSATRVLTPEPASYALIISALVLAMVRFRSKV